MPRMTATIVANTGPPPVRAVETEAAMGTLATVATRNRVRTTRPLPLTALADQVNCVQRIQSRRKTRPAWTRPAGVGSWTRTPTIWLKAKT
jgi:hypothetical protein